MPLHSGAGRVDLGGITPRSVGKVRSDWSKVVSAMGMSQSTGREKEYQAPVSHKPVYGERRANDIPEEVEP